MGKPFACGRARRRVLLIATTLLTSGLAAPAAAQVAGSQSVPPVRPLVDENGVDLLRGTLTAALADVAIGPNDHRGLRYGRYGGTATQFGSIEAAGADRIVSIGGRSDRFTPSGGGYVSTEGTGATLVLAGGTWTYVARDGTRAIFASNAGYSPAFAADDIARLGGIVFTDGTSREFVWTDIKVCPGDYVQGICESDQPIFTAVRLAAVTNNLGYRLDINYARDKTKHPNPSIPDLSYAQYEEWSRVRSVTARNVNVAACTPGVDACGPNGSWPTANYSASGVTDALGRAVKSHVQPGTDSLGRLTATRDGITYSYAFNADGVTGRTRVTDPAGGARTYQIDTTKQVVASFTDEAGHATSYAHDNAGRVTEISYPEGNKVQFTYDGRGNVLTTRRIAKAGWGQADIVTSATYPVTCADPETCNQPLTTTDARGHVTDYQYDATHGGIVRVTLPAPATGAARPETRYGYSLVSGRYLLTSVSTCSSGEAPGCIGTANEVRTTIAYGPAGAPDNFLPTSITTGAGDGSLAATTAIAYDALGNATHVDGPLPGPADTSRSFHDAVGQVTGVIGPDPDGAGAMLRRARRFTYNADGIVTRVEEGVAGGQSEGDLAAMTVLRQVDSAVDANRRKTRDTASAGGTTHAVTDHSYDALGRPLCTAVRMNLGSLGQPACARNPDGAHGPDRITRTTYTNRSEVAQVETGHGTADAIAETASYQPNGGIAFVADGKGNTSFIAQDGHDRIFATYYPSPAAPGTVNWSDYENVYFDLAGNVVHRRLRDGQVITYGHDALDRVTFADNPLQATSVTDTDVSYAYDNLGRLTQAIDNQGHYTRRSWDALGRMVSEESLDGGVKTIGYDLAGRRTRFGWADGAFVTYDRHADGSLAAIRESGTTLLATFGYDTEGRRLSLVYGNGASTSYGYDPLGRLATLSHDLAGTGSDVTFGYAYNPAGQIVSRTSTNGLYAWTGHGSGTTVTAVDGRNFLTAIGSAAASQDARGNLLSDGSATYGYNLKDQLVAKSGVTQLNYEPLGRLTRQWNGGGTLDWVGDELVAELTAGALTRRYVHGDGADDPMIWYEGTSKRYLHADERGSIIAVSDSAGAPLAINRYDEYGRSQTSATGSGLLTGRFGYTGQAWLPEVGLYSFKARMYDPHRPGGRFMQFDPSGYADGLNAVGAFRNDPVNLVDPSGLSVGERCVQGSAGSVICIPDDPSRAECEAAQRLAILASSGGAIVCGSSSRSDGISYGAPGGSIGGDGGRGTGGVGGGNAPPASQANAPKPKPKPMPEPTTQEQLCAALVGGGIAGLAVEGFSATTAILRGTTVAQLFLEAGTVAAANKVLLAVAIGGAAVYVADVAANGDVSRSFGKLVGCRK